MEYKAGLWTKTSNKGTKYCNGEIEINGVKYKVVMFKNNKTNPKAPDFNIIMEEKAKKDDSEKIYEDFGKEIDIDDSELAF